MPSRRFPQHRVLYELARALAEQVRTLQRSDLPTAPALLPQGQRAIPQFAMLCGEINRSLWKAAEPALIEPPRHYPAGANIRRSCL